MANQNVVFDETKKVLELMEESDETIFQLQQDLKQIGNLYEQTMLELDAVQNQKTENSADLEDNQIKYNIKEYNQKNVNLAQQVYSCCQELYTEIIIRKNEMDEMEKTFNKNEKKYLEKVSEYKNAEEKLKAELELLKKEKIEEEKRQKLETKNLQAENYELNSELNFLNEEIERCEQKINRNVVDRVTTYEDEIANIKECLKLADEDFCKTTALVGEMDKNCETAEAEATQLFIEMDKKLAKYRNEVELRCELLETEKAEYDQLSERLSREIQVIDDREKELERHNELLNQLEIDIREDQDSTHQKIVVCEKMYFENRELMESQQQVNKKLKMDSNLFKEKIVPVDAELEKIQTDLINLRGRMSKVDLNDILEAKRVELEQLNSTGHELKEQYQRKQTEIKTLTTNLNREIEEIELKNRKLQETNDTLQSEIGQLENAKDEDTKLLLKEQETYRQYQDEINLLVSRLREFDCVPPKLNFVAEESKGGATAKHAYCSAFEKELKVPRHWDSDSSVEGEDRRFSKIAKQKVLMRKTQGGKP